MSIRYPLAAVFFVLGHVLFAQTMVTSTSATDGDVKIHRSHKIVLFRNTKRFNKSDAQINGTQRQGHALPKKQHSHRLGREARVFKRQGNFAKKENNLRSRHRNYKKHSMARK